MEKHMKRLWKMEFLGSKTRERLEVRQGKALVHLTVFKEEPIMPEPPVFQQFCKNLGLPKRFGGSSRSDFRSTKA